MKSSISKLLTLCISILLWVDASAHDFEVDGIYYNITDPAAKTVDVTYRGDYPGVYDEYSGTVVIPNVVEYNSVEYSVTSIGECAFEFCDRLTSVIIPKSVTSIGQSAFYDCDGLIKSAYPEGLSNPFGDRVSICYPRDAVFTEDGVIYNSDKTSLHFVPLDWTGEFEIPNSVTSIGQFTFYCCSYLYAVTIPNSVISIGNYAFSACSRLTSVSIGNSVTSIGEGAFFGCSMHSVTIPISVTEIGDWAFVYCSALTTVTIPNSVTSLGNGAFRYCSGLTSVTIPNTVTSIGQYAFEGCSGLTTVTIPNSVTSIGRDAFRGCSELTTVTIPNSVTSIGESAFSCCSSLTSVTIPNSVTHIWADTFYLCSSLTTVTIGNSVLFINDYAFKGCTGLKDIYSLATVPPACSSYGVFGEVNKDNCALHVPLGCTAAYREAREWEDFLMITETDFSDIEEIKVDAEGRGGEVYNLQGVRVGKPSRPGIYIVNGKKIRI